MEGRERRSVAWQAKVSLSSLTSMVQMWTDGKRDRERRRRTMCDMWMDGYSKQLMQMPMIETMMKQ